MYIRVLFPYSEHLIKLKLAPCMNLCNSMRHDCSYIGSSDLNAKTVCAVLFLLIAAGPLLLELLLDLFAEATLTSKTQTPWVSLSSFSQVLIAWEDRHPITSIVGKVDLSLFLVA